MYKLREELGDEYISKIMEKYLLKILIFLLIEYIDVSMLINLKIQEKSVFMAGLKKEQTEMLSSTSKPVLYHRARFVDFPFIVRISETCTGIIINSQWILTNIYCRQNADSMARSTGQKLQVIAGHGKKLQTREVIEFKEESELKLKHTSLKNPYSCLKLSSPLTNSKYVSPATFLGKEVLMNTNCRILELGHVTKNGETERKQLMELKIDAGSELQDTCPCLGETDQKYIFCIKPTIKIGPCTGDYGSPLVCEKKAVGLFTYYFHPNCASPQVDNTVSDYCKNREETVGYIKATSFHRWIEKMTGTNIAIPKAASEVYDNKSSTDSISISTSTPTTTTTSSTSTTTSSSSTTTTTKMKKTTRKIKTKTTSIKKTTASSQNSNTNTNTNTEYKHRIHHRIKKITGTNKAKPKATTEVTTASISIPNTKMKKNTTRKMKTKTTSSRKIHSKTSYSLFFVPDLNFHARQAPVSTHHPSTTTYRSLITTTKQPPTTTYQVKKTTKRICSHLQKTAVRTEEDAYSTEEESLIVEPDDIATCTIDDPIEIGYTNAAFPASIKTNITRSTLFPYSIIWDESDQRRHNNENIYIEKTVQENRAVWTRNLICSNLLYIISYINTIS